MTDAQPRRAEHLAHSFPPIAGLSARVLILGSMPGLASLRAGQYYAHPRNQFWPIMGALLGRDLPRLTYPERVRCLLDADIALWDVLQSCQRPGSLDADIAPDSIVVNDFVAFFRRHPAIDQVYFNGAAAEKLFLRHGLTQLKLLVQPRFLRLPSTSPAHAALDFGRKLDAWRRLLDDKHLQTRAN
jgi:TDG/mug DNA glycosylase family protein